MTKNDECVGDMSGLGDVVLRQVSKRPISFTTRSLTVNLATGDGTSLTAFVRLPKLSATAVTA